MRAGVRRGVQRAVNHAVTRLVGEALALGVAASVARDIEQPSLIDGTKQAENNHVCGSAPLAVARRLAGCAATGQGLSARLSARGVRIGTRGAGALQSPAQNSRRVSPERSAAALSAAPAEAQRLCSGGPGSWPLQ